MIPDQAGPLTILAKRLAAGPPSIRALIHLLDQGEMVMEFVRIVREFLPDHEAEIMARSPDERVGAFAGLFEQRYFPLDDRWVMDDEEDYYALVTAIPIPRAAISYDDYHELEGWRPPFLLLLGIVASPWEMDEGARVPILETCAKLVGEDLIKLIPPQGWERAELHRRLDGTPLEGVALFADSLWRETDTVFLDVDWEEDLLDLDWTRENVEYLTERWPRAVQIQGRVREVEQWLEKAPAENFRHLLNVLTRKAKPTKKRTADEPRKNRTLMEVFGYEP